MKTLALFCAVMGLMLTAATARAADVTGSWIAESTMPDGSTFQLSFTFKQDGTSLTGTVQAPQSDAIAISDGKVDGNKISFKVSFNGMTISHDGAVSESGDEIKLGSKSDSADFPGRDMTLKRVKVQSPPTPAQTSTQAQVQQKSWASN
jgi:hypothetical protein